MRHSPRGYSHDTITKRAGIVRRYLVAHPDPYTVGVLEVEAWLSTLELGPSSRRDACSHVRAFYRWAIRTGRTDRDPTAAVELPRAARRLPRPAPPGPLAVAVSAAPPDVRAMLALMAGGGLRCCEVARLRWSDVDMTAGTVHVTGKFDADRLVAVPASVRRALAAIDHPGVYVFMSAAGVPYSAARVSHIVNRYLRRVGARFTAHQLRHRFATAALAACGDVMVVRDLLGHRSVNTTAIYAAITPGRAGSVSSGLEVPGL